MRQVFCATEGVSGDRCHCGANYGANYVGGRCAGCCVYYTRRCAARRARGTTADRGKWQPLVGPRQRLPQRKDISDLQVLRAFAKAAAVKLERYPYDFLMEETGAPFKVAYAAMDRADDRGLVNYGVSLRTGWLEPKGLALLPLEERRAYLESKGWTTAEIERGLAEVERGRAHGWLSPPPKP